MATLTIGGRKVKVDDAFKSMTPEQQQSTVDEIAHSLGLNGNSQLPDATGQPVGVKVRTTGDMQPQDYARGNSDMSAMTQQFNQVPQDTGWGDPVAQYGLNGLITGQRGPTDEQAAAKQNEVERRIRANMEARQTTAGSGGAATTASDALNGMMMDSVPFTDEIYAATIGNVGRMMRDGVNPVEAYRREHALTEAESRIRHNRSPYATAAGGITGAVLTGRGLVKGVEALPMIGSKIAEFGNLGKLALYGAATGAGQGEGTDRLTNAATGAATSVIAGTALNKIGGAIASKLAPKATSAIPASQSLTSEASALYDAAKASGTVIIPKAATRLIQNMEVSAGRLNDKLHPQTTGVIEYMQGFKGKPIDVQTFHDMRQIVSKAMNGASDSDAYRLQKIKTFIDQWAEKPPQGATPNGSQGLDLLKQANGVYHRAMKTSTIENLVDAANLKGSGKFTQSGEASGLAQEARALYFKLQKNSQGFKDNEIELLRQIGAGDTSGKVARTVAKFAPNGVVSLGGGSATGASIGGAFGGPIGAMVGAAGIPIAGKIAANSVDKAAVAAVKKLEQMVASGQASPAMKKAVTKMLGYTPAVSMISATEASRARQNQYELRR
jgi:hypothetical protein